MKAILTVLTLVAIISAAAPSDAEEQKRHIVPFERLVTAGDTAEAVCAEVMNYVFRQHTRLRPIIQFSDASQEALVRIYLRCLKVGPEVFLADKSPEKLKAYYYEAYRNLTLNSITRDRHNFMDPFTLEAETGLQSSREIFSPESEATKYVTDAINLAITTSKLEGLPTDREIAVLFGYVIGASNADIANAVGLSPPAISNIKSSAVAKIEKIFYLNDTPSAADSWSELFLTVFLYGLGTIIAGPIFIAILAAFSGLLSIILRPFVKEQQERKAETARAKTEVVKVRTVR